MLYPFLDCSYQNPKWEARVDGQVYTVPFFFGILAVGNVVGHSDVQGQFGSVKGIAGRLGNTA